MFVRRLICDGSCPAISTAQALVVLPGCSAPIAKAQHRQLNNLSDHRLLHTSRLGCSTTPPPSSGLARSGPSTSRSSSSLGTVSGSSSASTNVFPPEMTEFIPSQFTKRAPHFKLEHKMASKDHGHDAYGKSDLAAATPPTAKGHQLLREPLWNRGLSFTPEERATRDLHGLLPHATEDLQAQCARALKVIRSRQTSIDKYLYLSSVKAQNADLFYRLLMDNMRELMPLVYTPTIGDVCLQYSTLYTRPEALYISIKQRKSIPAMLRNWTCGRKPEICVVTDGSRILGLGDLGMNGVGISVGKLALYTAAAGIHPGRALPIVLDSGTDNEANLRDPLYLGLRQKRASPSHEQEFVDDFMAAARETFPEMLVQFEDFESSKAFTYLDRYRHNHRCFNDDIQGTGAVVLAGYIGAVNLSNIPIEDQRLVFMGAGSAGVGVAKQLVEYYRRRGLSEQEARDKFWLVDTKGLVTVDRGDRLAAHKKYFAREDNGGRQCKTLAEVIEYVRPSALVGLTATQGVFTETVVRALTSIVQSQDGNIGSNNSSSGSSSNPCDCGGKRRRPILFPLSNPLSKAECTFEQAVRWTGGSVIFASGSPFSPLTIQTVGGGGSPETTTTASTATPNPNGTNSTTFHPNQGNNVYVFPGLGLGAILSGALRVTDEMVYASAAALAGSLTAEEAQQGLIYPRIERVREASVIVAREVMKAARRGGVSTLPESFWAQRGEEDERHQSTERQGEEQEDAALTSYIRQRIYDPVGRGTGDARGRL